MPASLPKYPVVLNGTKLEVLQPGYALPIGAGGTGAETLADAKKNLEILPEAPPPLKDGTKKYVRRVSQVGSNINYTWEEVTNAASPMTFKGSKDATISFGRDTPVLGDVWLASATGPAHSSWIGLNGLEILKGALLVWDGAEWMVAEVEIPAHVLAEFHEVLAGTNDQKSISPKALFEASLETRKDHYPQIGDLYANDGHHQVRLNPRGILDKDITLGCLRVPEAGVYASYDPDTLCWHADGKWRPGDIVVFSDPQFGGIVGSSESTTLHPHWGEPAMAKATKGDMAIRLSVKSLYVPGHSRISTNSSVLNADGTEGRWFFIRTGEDGMPMADSAEVLKAIARDKVVSPNALGRAALSSPNPIYPSASNHYREGAYHYVRLGADGQINPGFLLGGLMMTEYLSASNDPVQHEADRRNSGAGGYRPGEIVVISNYNPTTYHPNWQEPQGAEGKLGDIAIRVPADNIYPNRADGIHGKWLFFRAGLEPATIPRIDITRRNGDTTSVTLD